MNLVVKEYQKVMYSVGIKTSLQSSCRLAFYFSSIFFFFDLS